MDPQGHAPNVKTDPREPNSHTPRIHVYGAIPSKPFTESYSSSSASSSTRGARYFRCAGAVATCVAVAVVVAVAGAACPVAAEKVACAEAEPPFLVDFFFFFLAVCRSRSVSRP
jgi:hypothetical protein